MQIQSLKNNSSLYMSYPKNVCAVCGTSDKGISFKGNVSPKFVNYVEGLRRECLASVPKQSSNLINNVCNGIIERANRVMKNCFPDSYTLSLGKEASVGQEVISMENSIIQKHIPEYSFVTVLNNIRGNSSPLRYLSHLNRAIKGNTVYIFSDGYGKNLFFIINIIDIKCRNLESYNKNKDMLNDFKGILEWWRDNINKLRAESPKEYQFQSCEELCDTALAMVKQYEN